MKDLVWVLISAVACITILAGAAIFMGHDNHLVTAAISGIVAIATGLTGYFIGKSKGAAGSGSDSSQDKK